MQRTENAIVSAISYVSKDKPCEHCGKPDWCYVFGNGASVCNRGSIGIDYEDSGKKDKAGSAILYPILWNKEKPKPQVISSKEWHYPDRQGNALAMVSRLNYDDGSKEYPQKFWNGKSWVFKKPKGMERSDFCIYRYAQIREAISLGKTIFICEGEKVADKLVDMGFEATTNIQGSKNFAISDCADLEGASRIVLVPDRDTPGLKLMAQWADNLPGITWLYPYPEKDWKNVPPSNGLDFFDWITDLPKTAQEIEDAIGLIPDSLKKIEVLTSTPLKGPQGWDDKEGKPTVETSTPLKEPRKEPARIYGGSKDLKTHELVEFVQNYIARDLELDDLRSEILLEGKRLSLGSDCKVWFYRKYGETAGKEDIYDVLLNFAKERRFNPVKRYLEKVAKQPKRVRIDDLATRYFGRSEKIYNRMVEMWLISAIARALDKGTEDNPGCQVDHTLILQSGQGKYKSIFFKVLGGAWFDDSVADIDSKDSLMIVHSSWIIELSELDRITSKKQAGSIKHWLTKKTDSYRKPYAKEIDPQLPRPCVFCGTVNPTRFLMDDENRRFWVISVSEELDAIDIPMITRERDAIWASAYYAYHLGGIIPLLTLLFQAQIQESPLWTLLLLMEPKQPWWPTASEAALIAAIGEQCKELDAWQDEIENWIKDRLYISSYQILTELLHIEPGNIKRGEDMRVMKILNSLGWVKETRKDIPDLDNGGIKKRRVRLNPDARFLDLDGKDGKVGKSLDIEASQDYQPHKKDGKRLVEEETTNLLPQKQGLPTLKPRQGKQFTNLPNQPEKFQRLLLTGKKKTAIN